MMKEAIAANASLFWKNGSSYWLLYERSVYQLPIITLSKDFVNCSTEPMTEASLPLSTISSRDIVEMSAAPVDCLIALFMSVATWLLFNTAIIIYLLFLSFLFD